MMKVAYTCIFVLFLGSCFLFGPDTGDIAVTLSADILEASYNQPVIISAEITGTDLEPELSWYLDDVLQTESTATYEFRQRPSARTDYTVKVIATVNDVDCEDALVITVTAPQISLSQFIYSGSMPIDSATYAPLCVDDKIYIFGGSDTTSTPYVYYDTVYMCGLNNDGTFTAWENIGSFEGIRQEPAAVYHNGSVFLIGGSYVNGTNLTYDPTVYYTSILKADVQPDGRLGPWSVAGSLDFGRRRPRAVVHNNRLYILGGITGQGLDKGPVYSIISAEITSDNTIAAFSQCGTITPPRGDYGMAIVDDYLILLGGYNSDMPSLSEQFFSDVNSVSMINTGIASWWTNSTDLPQSLLLPVCTVSDSHIFVFGGIYINNTPEWVIPQTIYRGGAVDGNVADWELLSTTMPANFVSFAAVRSEVRFVFFGSLRSSSDMQTTTGFAAYSTTIF